MLRKRLFKTILAILIFSGFLFFNSGANPKNIKMANAGAGDNVSGFAWSSNYGAISFNCTSDSSCGSHDYGVMIDPITGNFSKYAWSSNLGLVSFQENNPPNYNFNTNCQAGANCDAAHNCTACINSDKIYGWAKILSLDNDGWVRLDDDNPADAKPYGVTVATNDFHGYAWNGNGAGSGAGAGWISFNCAEGGSSGENVCAINGGHDYKVTTTYSANTGPTVTTGVPFFSNLCSQPLAAFLPWTVDSGIQTGYQIQVKTSTQVWTDALDLIDDSSSAVQYAFKSSDIDFGKIYNWRIKVKDSDGTWSDWEYGDDFTTAKHAYPTSNFTWTPAIPVPGEDVNFTDDSTVYGGSYISSRTWIFGNSVPGISNQQNPTVKFNSTTGNTAALTITDSDGYGCSSSTNLSASKKKPTWIETK
jgi:hypothetical protein